MTMRLAIFGSTGSIGTNALAVLAAIPDSPCQLIALSGHTNIDLLVRQAQKWQPEYLIITQQQEKSACDMLDDYKGKVLWGEDALEEFAASDQYDSLLLAITGSASVPAAYAAASSGKRLLLANKEALVAAGELIVSAAHKSGAKLVPVDSEHNAIWQCLAMATLPGKVTEAVKRIEITASGGPFWRWSAREMYHASPDQACAHPNWKMGNKISVDSANMVNKALELIEARWLFDLSADQLGVLVHPQSLVHGLVHLHSGSTLAQLAKPDMRVAIATAMFETNNIASTVDTLSLLKAQPLEFFPPDDERFSSLPLVYHAMAEGKDRCLCFDIGNEAANLAFRQGRIPFGAIVEIIDRLLQQTSAVVVQSIDQVRERQQQLLLYADRLIAALG